MKRLIILFGLLFISCSSNPPEWYNKIYNDNNYFIYSTGVGKTKKEAINNALANISSKVSVIIKSIYKSKKYQYKGDDTSVYSNNSIFDIEAKTNPITFTQYKILKIEKKEKYYVLIKINRLKNAKYMCDNTDYPNIDKSKLNIFLNHKKILYYLNKTIKKLKSINALYPICKNRLDKIVSLKNEIINKFNHLNISIRSDNQRIKNIIESILNIKTSSNGNIKILIHQNIKHKTVGNYKISTIYLNFKINDAKNSKNYSLICAASSIQDFNTAKELAYQECKKKLKNIFNY